MQLNFQRKCRICKHLTEITIVQKTNIVRGVKALDNASAHIVNPCEHVAWFEGNSLLVVEKNQNPKFKTMKKWLDFIEVGESVNV